MFRAQNGKTRSARLNHATMELLPANIKTRRKRQRACDELEQVRGIEPPCSAWEADILPLNYTCIGNQLLYYTITPAALQEEKWEKIAAPATSSPSCFLRILDSLFGLYYNRL